MDIFSIPETSNVLQPDQLIKYLTERKVSLISAAPGFGKTTAVAAFINSRRYKNCWINYNSNIDTVKKFLTILATGMAEQFSEEWRSNSTDDDSEKISMLIKHASKHHSSENPFCVVIDNFELSNAYTEIQEELEKIFLSSGKSLKFFLISRTEPAYSFRKIRAAKELMELRKNDLLLQPEDLRKLFTDVYRIALIESDYERIFELTGGWICAVSFLLERLAMHSKKEQRKILDSFYVRKTLPEIDDFIRQEVLAEISSEKLKFLVYMNLAESITPELVEDLENADGKQFLIELEDENIFIEQKDQTLYTYRFSPFFAEYLNREFEKLDTDEKTGFFLKLSSYYQRHQAPELSIKYLLSAGETEKAYAFLSDYADDLLKTGEYEGLRALLEHFSEDEIKEDPLLSYYDAISNSILNPEESQSTLLRLLPRIQEDCNFNREAMIYTVLLTSSFFYQRSRSFIVEITKKASVFIENHGDDINIERKELLTTLLPLGEWWISSARHEVFEAALRAEEISHRFKNREAFLCARLVLCRFYLERGAFQEARHILAKTEILIKEEERYSNLKYYRTLLCFYKGDTLFYMGEIAEAINEIQRGISLAPKDFAFLPYLQLNLIIYNLYLDNIETAESLYNDYRDDPHGENIFLQFYFDYFFKLILAYRNKNIRRTDYFCRRLLAPENEIFLKVDYPYPILTIIESLIFLKDYDTADSLLERLSEDLNEQEFPYTTATAKGLHALLESRRGNKARSKSLAAEMNRMLKKGGLRNIEISDPVILKEITGIAANSPLKDSPRFISEEPSAETETNKKPLEIYTLGQFRVFIDGNEISSTLLSSQKRVMDLMKFLIVFRRNGVMKERIYELFWPRYSYKSARDNLNTIIYRLRKMMGDSREYLLTDVNTIQFNPEFTSIDVDRFLEYLSKAQNEDNSGQKNKAISLYRECVLSYPGDFLKEDLYYDFIRDERENLQGKYRSALFKLVQLSLYIEDYIEALEWSKKLVEADPLCEAAYRLLMICSAYVGNRSEVPRLFDKLNKKLQTYYKIQADDKTIILKDKLIAGTEPSPADWKAETII